MSDKHYVGLDLASYEDNGSKYAISRVTLITADDTYYTAGDDTGLEITAECPYATQPMVDAILAQLKGYKFQGYSAESANLDPAAELGDGITASGIYSVIGKISDGGTGYVDVSAPGEAELDEEYPTIGPQTQEFQRNLQATRKQIEDNNRDLRLAIENATEYITGNEGGYVVIRMNEDNKPYEILIMDTDDINTAKNVWRWNKSGFGHSNKGYRGPFETAITQDGSIVATYITTGALNAAIVSTGILKSKDSTTFYLDLDKGILRMKATELTISGQTVDQISKDNANSALDSFINGDFADTVSELKTQADQKAETWYQTSDPSTAWTTTAQKNEHKGDIWFNSSSNVQKSYRWNGSSWVEMKSSPPKEVFDEIDGKAQIFISQPKPPYDTGDLWFNGTTSDIMTCIQKRTSGSYVSSDWQKRNKYIDQSAANTAAEKAVNDQTQLDIFNKLTNNGQAQGIYLENGRVYLNATYIASGTISASKIYGGTLTVGGASNGNGVLRILSSGNAEFGRIDNTGFACTGDAGGVGTGKVVMKGSLIKFYLENSSLGSGFFETGTFTPTISYSYGTQPQLGMSIHSGTGMFLKVGGYTYGDKSSSLNTFSGAVKINGNFSATGEKNRIIKTKNYGNRLQYCYETASPMFGDSGQGKTDSKGICYVYLDDVFLETVDTGVEYQVFLQKEGPGDVWIAEKTKEYFIVNGTENLKFAWEIKVVQYDLKLKRLEQLEEENEDIIDYEENYQKEIEKIIEEQEAILYETA